MLSPTDFDFSVICFFARIHHEGTATGDIQNGHFQDDGYLLGEVLSRYRDLSTSLLPPCCVKAKKLCITIRKRKGVSGGKLRELRKNREKELEINGS